MSISTLPRLTWTPATTWSRFASLAQREVRFHLLDVDVDLVDLELADVDVDVKVMTGARALEVRAVQAWRYARVTRSSRCWSARGSRCGSATSSSLLISRAPASQRDDVDFRELVLRRVWDRLAEPFWLVRLDVLRPPELCDVCRTRFTRSSGRSDARDFASSITPFVRLLVKSAYRPAPAAGKISQRVPPPLWLRPRPFAASVMSANRSAYSTICLESFCMSAITNSLLAP
jgi:hypothetical protein